MLTLKVIVLFGKSMEILVYSAIVYVNRVYNKLYFLLNNNNCYANHEMKLVLAFYLHIPCLLRSRQAPTPKGEISPLKGNIGWGVPLGNEGSEAFEYLCILLYTHTNASMILAEYS